MSFFAKELIGAWPVYPGHPCTIALCILEKYPALADAFAHTEHGWPQALGDGDIPGAGGCVYQGLDLIDLVRTHGKTPDEAVQWGVEAWARGRLGGDHRGKLEEGIAEADRIGDDLRARLARIAGAAR